MRDRPKRITDAEAADLLRRATELQARAEARGHALAPVAEEEDEEGFALEQVAAAAESAGIAPGFVSLALAEGRLPDAGELQPSRWTVRWARRLIDENGAIEASRLLPAPPERVFDAVRAVFPAAPFQLLLEDSVGEDPLHDGVMVYRVGSATGSEFASNLNWADVRVVLATLRAEGEGTRLSLRAPLFRRGVNLAVNGVLGVLGAWGGMFAGGAVAGLIAAGPGLVLVPVLAGMAAGGAGGLGLFRGVYRSARDGGEAALQRLLQAVSLHLHPAASPAIGAGSER
jgi:hypothetical protein